MRTFSGWCKNSMSQTNKNRSRCNPDTVFEQGHGCHIPNPTLCRRCVSQMVLARVANVKSGWKSMFMVFTTAAADDSPGIVRLAFETVEKIVRVRMVENLNYTLRQV